jgi:hyperosmotically inducible periplasmic protein
MRTLRLIVSLCALGLIVVAGGPAAAQDETAQAVTAKVRRALARVPYYGVFDLVAFKVDRGVVTLQGYAHRSALRREVEDMVRRVTELDVKNEIEILPVSNDDDRIRWEVYRRVYTDDFADKYVAGGTSEIRLEVFNMARFPGMEPYGTYPVHVIVKHRRVALIGSVASEFDKNSLLIRAKQTVNTLGLEDQVSVRTRG